MSTIYNLLHILQTKLLIVKTIRGLINDENNLFTSLTHNIDYTEMYICSQIKFLLRIFSFPLI